MERSLRDVRFDVEAFRPGTVAGVTDLEALRTMTLMAFRFPSMTRMEQARWAARECRYGAKAPKLAGTRNDPVRKPHLCPSCLDEKGTDTTDHLVPGNVWCDEHHEGLVGITTTLADEDCEPVPLPRTACAEAFAKFCHDWLELAPDMCVEDTALMAHERCAAKGVLPGQLEGAAGRIAAESPWQDCTAGSLHALLDRINASESMDPWQCLWFAAWLCDFDAALLASYNQSPTIAVPSEYELLDGSRKDVALARCPDCGAVFCAPRAALAFGWGYPLCYDGDEEALVRRHLATLGLGLVGRYTGPNGRITAECLKYHKRHHLLARDVLFKGKGCDCEGTRESEVGRILASRGMALVTLDGDTATGFHPGCGRTFRRDVARIRARNWCPRCYASEGAEDEFKAKVEELCGDEYEVVGP